MADFKRTFSNCLGSQDAQSPQEEKNGEPDHSAKSDGFLILFAPALAVIAAWNFPERP